VPETGEIIVFSLISLASLVAWRYLERGLNWLEPHAGKRIPRFGMVVLQPVAANPYLLLAPLVLAMIIWASVAGDWLTVVMGLAGVLVGLTVGLALAEAVHRGWMPKGVEHIIFGLGWLSAAGLLPALMALEISPWFGFAAIGMAPAGIVELWRGVQMIRGKLA
jgi:hypothetical protein